MPVYRYQYIMFPIRDLRCVVPGEELINDYGTSPAIYKDIEAPEASKVDLDSCMETLGFIFDSELPP